MQKRKCSQSQSDKTYFGKSIHNERYLLCELYQFPSLCSSAAGILLSVSCIFVADGVKTELQGEDSLEVEPLVCRVRVIRCKVVFCALVTVLPES